MTNEYSSSIISFAADPSAQQKSDPLNPTIFHEPWWLDIATQGGYSIAEVLENGKTIARLPYFLRKRKGVRIATLPPLTHFLGPAVDKPATKFLQRLDITKELIGKLPPAELTYVKCQREVQDVIAFQAAGFRCSVQFTHEISPRAPSALWKALRDKGRNVIRRAAERHCVGTGDDPAAFMHFYRQCIESGGKSNGLDIAICTSLIAACRERGRGRIYEARDKAGDVTAAIFCAWDHVASYYLLTARHRVAHLGAISLLVWEAITDAAKRGLIFDFDGFDSEGGARFAANFTTNITPRYIAVRESAPVRIFHAAQSLYRERNCFC